MNVENVRIETLWWTTSEQCELVFVGVFGCRLRLWVNGALLVDEEVFDWAQASKRANELRRECRHDA